MRNILRNPDRWEWFSEDLEAKKGILLRLERIGDMIGHIRYRYARNVAGTRGKKVTH